MSTRPVLRLQAYSPCALASKDLTLYLALSSGVTEEVTDVLVLNPQKW